MPALRSGYVVLHDNGWNHNVTGRPHLVLKVEDTQEALLCPLSSTQADNHGVALPRRSGGPRHDSYFCAIDGRDKAVSNLDRRKPDEVQHVLYVLTPEEFAFALVEVNLQLLERKTELQRRKLLAQRRDARQALPRR